MIDVWIDYMISVFDLCYTLVCK